MPSAKWMRKKLRETIPSSAKQQSCKCFELWRTYFLQGTDKDRWNDQNGAIEKYQMLIEDLKSTLETSFSCTGENVRLKQNQKDTVKNIIRCLTYRIDAIRNPEEKKWMTVHELDKIKKIFKNFDEWDSCFPILILEETTNTSVVSLLSQDSGMGELYSSEENINYNNNHNSEHTLQSKLPRQPGLTRLSIQIHKFAVKDLKKVCDPYIAISIRDRDSVNLADIQYTKSSTRTQDYHAEFNNCNYEVQRYVEKIPKGSSIFFELRSSTDKKTKYYSVLKREQFATGRGYLEIYKGPVDYHHKQLRKVSQKKPLYCHISMTLLDQ